MRRIIFSLLFLVPTTLLAEDVVSPAAVVVLQMFEEQNKLDIDTIPDLVDKDVKVTKCIDEYIKKQSKSYAKIVQNNLYDLIHNFDRIASKIYGKKQPADEMSYDEKLEALAIVQCEAYYKLGVLK